MRMSPSVWRDIDRYYKNTWVKFQEFGDSLFYINEVNDKAVTGIDTSGGEFILYLSEEVPYHMTYVLPHRAVFQYRDYAYLLSRNPARQYKRGLSTDNTTLRRLPDGGAMDIKKELLVAYVEKQAYATLREALYGKGRQKSLALGSRFSFDKSSQNLYLDTRRIAAFSRDVRQLLVLPIFKTDVQALVAVDPFEVEVVDANGI